MSVCTDASPLPDPRDLPRRKRPAVSTDDKITVHVLPMKLRLVARPSSLLAILCLWPRWLGHRQAVAGAPGVLHPRGAAGREWGPRAR